MMENSSSNPFYRNSRLFTALGVFGGISVYFTQLQLETKWRRLGIVSALIIFLLIAIAIQRNLPPEASDKKTFDYIINVLLQRPEDMVFYVSLWTLVISVSAIILNYSNTFLFLVQFFLFIGGFAAAQRLVVHINRSFDEALPDDTVIELGDGNLPIVFSLHIIRNALYAAILGSGGLVLVWMSNLLNIEQLVAFRSPSLLSAILVGTLAGFGFGGLAFSVLGLGMIVIHRMAISIRKQGVEDEFVEFMQKLGFNAKKEYSDK